MTCKGRSYVASVVLDGEWGKDVKSVYMMFLYMREKR